jgi:hypothetical protein
MISANLNSIVEFLHKHKYSADIQKETQQVFTVLKINKEDFPLFFRLFDESRHLQMLLFVPTQLVPDAAYDVSRLLHMLNKEMDLPGFGMDETAGVVFYRLMIPAMNKKIDEDLLLGYVKTATNVCELFMGPISAVAQGQATLDEILRKAQEAQENQ